MLHNFNAAYSLADTLYGVMSYENDFEDIALEGWSRIGNKHTRLYRYIGDVVNGKLEIDFWNWHEDPYWTRGKLVKYDEGDGVLYFSHDYKRVMVVYHGILMDDETQLPLLNDKELAAVAAWVAYVTLYKEGIRKRDGNIIKLAQVVQQDWLRLCNAARIPEHFTQNDMDRILDVKVRWDRKQYGKSLKPIL